MRYKNTQTKMSLLRLKYQVIEMWGCQFREILLRDEKIRQMVKEIHIEFPLELRDAFCGGRTEMFYKYAKGTKERKILYRDVCSLYPYICKYGVFPTGHPIIITNPLQMPNAEKFKEIVGFAKIRILPPKNLRLPVLGVKINGKLLFGLCNECMTTSNQNSCTHTDEQRIIKASFACCEIAKALELGYKLIECYEVWKYFKTQFNPQDGSGGIFAAYIDKFLKLKQEASGYPMRVATDADKDAFIKLMKDREKIDLDKTKIESNPGLRSLSKMCLNSLW